MYSMQWNLLLTIISTCFEKRMKNRLFFFVIIFQFVLIQGNIPYSLICVCVLMLKTFTSSVGGCLKYTRKIIRACLDQMPRVRIIKCPKCSGHLLESLKYDCIYCEEPHKMSIYTVKKVMNNRCNTKHIILLLK